MDIDRNTLLNCPPEEAAAQLYETGKELQGANLRRSSWLLIANALHVQKIADILLQRLQAATTRQDALRVLRIARKNVRERRKGTGSSRGKSHENPQTVADENSRAAILHEEEQLADEREWEEELEGIFGGDFEEWLAEQRNPPSINHTRIADLLPVSTVQEAVGRYAWDRHVTDRPKLNDMRSHIDDTTYSDLLSMIENKPELNLSETELNFFHEHKLDTLLEYITDPHPSFQVPPLRDGIALAGAIMIEEHSDPNIQPFVIDWEAIEGWLSTNLRGNPQANTVPSIIRCAYAFFQKAPTPLLTRLLKKANRWHSAWANLIVYAYPRVSELIPGWSKQADDPNEWWTQRVYIRNIHWEQVLDAGLGSKLTRYNLQKNVEDLFKTPRLKKNRFSNGCQNLLLAGGGTLRRMDYPSFTLTCRPSITMVRLETFSELVKLAQQLQNLDRQVNSLNRSSLSVWIQTTFQNLFSDNLPKDLPQQIAAELEHHGLAYLMLKERLFRDSFEETPFRIRRKHIQRFWAEQTDAENDEQKSEKLPMPANLLAARKEFGEQSVKEALAHAMLDHFKDDWPVPEVFDVPLKETLLTLLRSVAVTFRLRPSWMPSSIDNLSENDLEHTQEVANFLIQQTENAPLELAQALVLAPQQGLPRLAGGGVTALERNCRQLVKNIAGVAQEKIGGEARIFTCQPISKTSALNRGNLAGDCSSGSVPMRALSPHHTYYGIFENGKQQRGYITVYEAWALEDEKLDEKFYRSTPVLCLETINVPIRIFDAVQQDLLVIFEAIAKSRGLVGGLVLITGIGTWNYQNGEVLRQSRRFRQGKPVILVPADPASWNVYLQLAPEAESYTAFYNATTGYHNNYFRLLAPFQPDQDVVEPENLAEAKRIAALPPKRLRVTARYGPGPAGFISEYPEIL